MASSSSCSWRYDVFPSFSGEDVRKSFLSHLLKELNRKSINTFIDHGVERSRPIAPELLWAIRVSRISIVIFSKNYASSTWCLNELVEIHKCFMELDQVVIPIFYNVDPSEVRKQTGEFGVAFMKTCKGKTDYEKQRWMQALTNVANLAGEHLRNWCDEANMIETIANDVSNKLITPSNCFGDSIGMEAHLEAMDSMLCLESKEARMVGIWGPSGIGKSTIGRALFSQLSSQFPLHAFVTYKRTSRDDYGTKLCWEEQFLSDILCQRDIKVLHLGAVEQRLKHKKVLIVIDDVDDLELLKTLVGQPGWFGIGSRIVVITKDKQLLKSHKIDLVYEVDFPSQDLALQMFCRCAFGQNIPHEDFIKLAGEVANLAGNLPLGLNVLGSSLRGKDREEWIELLPKLRNGLDGKIERTLRVGYDELDDTDQELFLYIACLLNGRKVDYIKNLLGDSVNIGLKILADKSLIRITPPGKTVQMHNLLQKLGKEIVRVESIYNPGKRRFLVNTKDICDVFTENTGTENVLGMSFNTSEIEEPLFINEQSFKGMRKLTFLKVHKEWSRETEEGRLYLPQGFIYLPRKLRLLYWDDYPMTSMRFNFKAEILIKLTMENSKLEKLWEGVQPLRSLKKLRLDGSSELREIPNLSNAIYLEKLNLWGCTSLVTLPSSFRKLSKLKKLSMEGCTKLEALLPFDVDLGCLDYVNLSGCSRLRSFPRISKNSSGLILDGTAIEEEDSFYLGNIFGLTKLDWNGCPLKCLPPGFCPENLVYLTMRGSKLEKLWEGIQSLGSLLRIDLSGSENLKEFPDLSTAINLDHLELNYCKSLVMLPSSLRNLNKLTRLEMQGCTKLKFLPTNVCLESLEYLDLRGCSSLTSFPRISKNISELHLNGTEIQEKKDCSFIGEISGLTELVWSNCPMKYMPSNFCAEYLIELFMPCSKLEKLWEGLQPLRSLKKLRLDGSSELREIPNLSNAIYLEKLNLWGCTSLVTLPSSFRKLSKLKKLSMEGCTKLEALLPFDVDLGCLDYVNLSGCSRLRSFPRISKNSSGLILDGTAIEEEDSFYLGNIFGLTKLDWNGCPLKCLPPGFCPENLVYLTMRGSKLEKLWEGIQSLGSLLRIDLSGSENLKEFPDLSTAINLDHLELNYCKSLVMLPSSLRNLNKLTRLEMQGCTKLKFLPTNVCLESLEYLDLRGCSSLTSFPRISKNISELHLNGTEIQEKKDCSFIGEISGLTELVWSNCPMKYMPSNFCAEYLIELFMPCSKLEKLWEGLQSLGGLRRMDLSGSESLKEIPNLSKATNLEYLNLTNCKNLVMLPSTIRNLKKLVTLNVEGCTGLEFLPNDVDLVSLNPFLHLSGCSRLRSFPQISTSITYLSLDLTAITEVPSWIENVYGLTGLTMKGCKNLKRVASNFLKLKHIMQVDFSDCEGVTRFGDASAVTRTTESRPPMTEVASFHYSYLTFCAKNCKSLQHISHYFLNQKSSLKFHNCVKLDRDARELILQSDFDYAVLPGGEVPTYFRHQAYGSSLTISLCKSSLSQNVLRFKACIMLERLTLLDDHSAKIIVHWFFRGKSNSSHLGIDVDSCHVDQLVVFHFELCPSEEVDSHPHKLDYEDVEFKFEYHGNASCSCMRFLHVQNNQTCPRPLQKIKGCGLRFLNVFPSEDGSGTSSQTEYSQQSRETDRESGRSKKRKRMTERTSEEPLTQLTLW